MTRKFKILLLSLKPADQPHWSCLVQLATRSAALVSEPGYEACMELPGAAEAAASCPMPLASGLTEPPASAAPVGAASAAFADPPIFSDRLIAASQSRAL
jgi:hypothetical protein